MHSATRKPADAALKRLGPLSKLPVFFDLQQKRALVAGGGAGAAWKAEFLAAAGAHVDIFATDASPEMQALLARGAASGSLNLHEREWADDDLLDRVLAVGDFETVTEAKSFKRAARAAGVPVNTVDKPGTCDFIFGSVVNRSPAVIAISTDGAAPILGQAIRQRIETLLPPAFSEWADLARKVREQVMGLLRPGAERRRFWENFSDRAFSGSASPAEDNWFQRLIDASKSDMRHEGRVTLVGAGPGDPELLTLKAMRALQAADIILFDDLIAPEILELARREARRMMVGKRGGRESCAQEDIQALMVKLARQGKHVVRLKSGDPMIFGRAGEEIASLHDAGIPVTVVSGITAAQGLSAGLGISLTHREHAQSVTFLTGHSREGELPTTINWQFIAEGKATAIVYMGARKVIALVQSLYNAGLNPQTPSVAVASVSTPRQQYWAGRLADLVQGVSTLPSDEPILIGIGDVFDAAIARNCVDMTPCAHGLRTLEI